MDFSVNKQDTFAKRIISLPDQPNMQPNELKAYFDSSPEELRQAHNGLCDALSTNTAAAGLGFQRTAGVPADNVQTAVENVQQQLDAAVMGNIPSGSVTGDKLAQDVRDRFTAIENAAKSEASTRSSGDNNLQEQINTHTAQISSLTTTKCELYYGSYDGNDEPSQYISLGFAPKAVLCAQSDGQIEQLGRSVGAIAFPGTVGGLRIEGNGFRAYYDENYYWNNASRRTFMFIAVK